MAGHNEEDGTIDLIYAAVGRTTMLMDQLEVGDCFARHRYWPLWQTDPHGRTLNPSA